MYITRHIEEAVRKTTKGFASVIVTGARQVGKTTLYRNILDLPYATFDDPFTLTAAKTDPVSFFDSHQPPLILDEIQYAPELFPYIKMRADESGRKGLFFLTGSQQFQLMKKVSESLAGRIGILQLHGLSSREILESSFTEPFTPEKKYIRKRGADARPMDVWARIYKGSMPVLWANKTIDRDIFYSSYMKSYIERDVRELSQVGDETVFLNFVRLIAGNTGTILNLDNIAHAVSISPPTAKRWLSILETSGLVYLLKPFFTSAKKRLIKSPKIYFLDTGLASFLGGWPDKKTLENGAVAGAFFETYVVSEIIKSYANKGLEPPIYYYRDSDKNEIDIVIQKGNVLHPVEIKKSKTPSYHDTKVFVKLDAFSDHVRGEGAIVSMSNRVESLPQDSTLLPVSYL
jgi:predicted AAA+ superfamily ATPase